MVINSDQVVAPGVSTKTPAKRNRNQLSCNHCRHAKLKCDREKPCSQCAKRGRSSQCTFPPPAARKRPAISMQNRLKHLESLVKGAMTGQPPPGEPVSSGSIPNLAPGLQTHSEESPVSDASGRVVQGLETNEATYVGATHWAAILDDIEEVKAYFSESEEETSPGHEGMRTQPDVSLLFNNTASPATIDDLLVALPERSIVNRLISRYFNSNSPALHIIHKPTFQKHYRKFWADPQNSPISFIALLYAFMCLGAFAIMGSGEENADTGDNPIEMIQTYRRCCAQCLGLSNYMYTKHPGPYTLETFLIYMECEFLLNKGEQMGCYLIVGVAVRLALRMGYHRDSDLIGGNLTPYQGEMRRRVWHLLKQMDLLTSFHNGLPSMIQAINSDARVPLNLQDQDFDESSTALPAPRPETEMTIMSYALAKGRLARVFGKMVEQANLLTLPSYAEVKELDRELQQAHSTLPSFLHLVPIDLCITDSTKLIIQRFSLAVLYQKSRCILHRKYLMKEKENPEYSYSKNAAIESSLELLRLQSEVHDATQPGGILCKDLWIISSLAIHDLLLAAVIIYSCLIQDSTSDSPDGEKKIPNTRQLEMIHALEKSYRIWLEIRSPSADTRKAHAVLANMLRRVNSIFRRHNGQTSGCSGVNAPIEWNNTNPISSLSLNESISVPETSVTTLDNFSGGHHEVLGDSLSLDSQMMPDVEFGSIPTNFFGEIIDTPMNLDWDHFDNLFRQVPDANDQPWPDTSLQDFDLINNNNHYDL